MKDSGNCVFRLRLLRSKAGVFQFSSVRKKRTPVRAENKDLLRNHVDKLSKFRFALSNPFLGPLSIRNIANGTRNQHAILGLEGAETDLHRKLMSILMQAVEFQPRPHWPRARVCHKLPTESRVPAPEPRRYQDFDFLPQ